MFSFARRIADSDEFDRITLMLLLLNAAILGVDCSPVLSQEYANLIFYVLWISQAYFVAEVAIRMLAHGPRVGSFFGSFWNRFDFIIVAVSLLPAVGSFVTVARLFRVLRVLRIMTVSDRLRSFLIHTRRSVDEASYFALIWGIVFYVFGVSGHTLFSEIDPDHWGSLGSAMRSLLFISLLQEIPQIAEGLDDSRTSATIYLILFAASWLFLLVNVIGAITAQHLESRRSGKGAE